MISAGTPVAEEGDALTTLIGRAVDESREVVTAEIAVYKAKATERFAAYKSAIILFSVAGVLALAALIALLVGLILSLATLIGPGLATAAVVLVVFAVAGVLAFIGKGRLAPPDLTKAS